MSNQQDKLPDDVRAESLEDLFKDWVSKKGKLSDEDRETMLKFHMVNELKGIRLVLAEALGLHARTVMEKHDFKPPSNWPKDYRLRNASILAADYADEAPPLI